MPDKKKKNDNEYTFPEKVGDIAKWTFEGATRDAKKWLHKIIKGGQGVWKKADEATPLTPAQRDRIQKDVPKPNPNRIKDRFKEEEEAGIKRGKNAWK